MPTYKSRRSGVDLRKILSPPPAEIETKAFGLCDDIGIIPACSIRYSQKQVRQYAIESEREYLLNDEEKTDEQVWRALKRQGYRVVPVVIRREYTVPSVNSQ